MTSTTPDSPTPARYSACRSTLSAGVPSDIAAFFRMAEQYRPLSAEEETRLFAERSAALQSGNESLRAEANARLACAHLRLVAEVVSSYKGRVDYPELISACCRALMQALDGFDAARGCSFRTYATPWLKQAATRAQRRALCGSTPFNYRADEKARKLRAAQARLSAEWGRTPTEQELAESMGADVKEVREALNACRPCCSLQQPVRDDGNLTYGEQLTDGGEGAVYDSLNYRQTEEVVLHNIRLFLSANEQYTLLRRLGIGGSDDEASFETIARELQVSSTRVKQYYHHACGILRELPDLQELHRDLCA